MEILTFIGQAAKRQEDYVDRAKNLAESNPSLDNLEEEMTGRAEALARKLRDGKITFPEFKRASAEDTLVGSLASYILGSRGEAISSSMFSSTMGQMQYLWGFFEDVNRSISNGRLAEDTSDFEEDDETEGSYYYPYPEDEEVPLDDAEGDQVVNSALSAVGVVPKPRSLAIPVGTASPLNAAVRAMRSSEDDVTSQQKSTSVDPTLSTERMTAIANKGTKPRATPNGPATWRGVLSRLKRFLVTPLYRWFKTGEFNKKLQNGFKEMRRVSRGDQKVCPDCRYFDSLGWAPVGSLPMPGLQCRCHDRCRCQIEYR
jgi:hypothetical protein